MRTKWSIKSVKVAAKLSPSRRALRKKTEVEKLFSATEKAFGKLDVLVNNAGVYKFMPLEEITEQNFIRMFDTNVLGMILATQEALKYFNQRRRQHDQHQFAGELTYATDGAVYSGTKGAVDAITRIWRKNSGRERSG